jgi:putative tryptophan/tyrosine transport system substrate-binding protein
MIRRAIALRITLALGLLVAPLAAAPPPGKVYRIGYLGTDPPPAPRWDALLVLSDALISIHRRQIAEFATQQHLPSVFAEREWVVAGGLMSYGPSLPDLYRRAATYVDKILKGTMPGDLPMEQPMKFELVLNLKTAQALGLTIPAIVLFRADEVIQ